MSTIILYDFVSCGSRHYTDNRGLSLELLANGFEGLLTNHRAYKARAAQFNITLGLALWHPWGRGGTAYNGQHYQQLPNGEYTTQRLDGILEAEAAGFTWITDDLRANTTPSETFIYTGSVPYFTYADAGLSTLISDGYGFAFDALTVFDVGSPTFTQALTLFGTNKVLAEANKTDKGLPLLAFADFWTWDTRVAPADAPANSAWWWRNETQDIPWNLEIASAMVGEGLKPWVNLSKLDGDQRDALFKAVATSGKIPGYIPPVSWPGGETVNEISKANWRGAKWTR